jgi:hypothetical protein
MAGSLRRLGWLAGAGVWFGLGLGCQHSRTPERTCQAFLRGISEGDAGAVFENLLETTRWSFSTVAKNHRRMRTLVESSYPPAERSGALGRLYGADFDGGRELFNQIYSERYAAAWTSRLGSGEPLIKPSPDKPGQLTCQRAVGQPFSLARSPSGQWGVADLDLEWEQAQLRAVHDLETVKKNADLYKRLSAPPPK